MACRIPWSLLNPFRRSLHLIIWLINHWFVPLRSANHLPRLTHLLSYFGGSTHLWHGASKLQSLIRWQQGTPRGGNLPPFSSVAIMTFLCVQPWWLPGSLRFPSVLRWNPTSSPGGDPSRTLIFLLGFTPCHGRNWSLAPSSPPWPSRVNEEANLDSTALCP